MRRTLQKMMVAFAAMIVCLGANAGQMKKAAADETPNKVAPINMLGTPFKLSNVNNCTVPTPADAARKFTFNSQWAHAYPNPRDFKADEVSKVVVEFAEPLEYYYNTHFAATKGGDVKSWSCGSGMNPGATEWTIDVTEDIYDLAIQNVQGNDSGNNPNSFTIKNAYMEKVDGTKAPVIFDSVDGWGAAMEVDAEVTDGKISFNGKWAMLGLTGVDNERGELIVRLYSNESLPEGKFQLCIKDAYGKDAWPQFEIIDNEDLHYAKAVIDRGVQSIAIQWTDDTPGTLDIAAVTYELLPETVTTTLTLSDEEVATLSDHSDVTVETSDALLVEFENVMAAEATYVINEMVPVVGAESTTWDEGAVVAEGNVSISAKGFATFDEVINFLRGKKYQLTLTYKTMNPNDAGTTIKYGIIGSYIPQPDLDGKDLLLKNVATGLFLNGANSWGTKASVVKHGQFMTFAKLADGKYTIDSHISNGGASHFLGDNNYVDAGAKGYVVYFNGDGQWTIKDGDKYFAANANNTEANFDGTEENEYSQWVLISKEDLLAAAADATVQEPVDLTPLIGDANMGRNNQDWSKWNNAGAAKNGAVENFNAEKWGGNSQTFDFNQTVTDLPNGLYTIKVQGYYRYNNTNDNTNAIAEATHANGTEKINSFVYANDYVKALKSIADAEAVASFGKTPFSQGEASTCFNNGLYQNEMTILVTDGEIKLGITKTSHPGCDWTVWDNFELEYLGSEDQMPAAEFDELELINGSDVYVLNNKQDIDVPVTDGIHLVFKGRNTRLADYRLAVAAVADGITNVKVGDVLVDNTAYVDVKGATSEFYQSFELIEGVKFQLTIKQYNVDGTTKVENYYINGTTPIPSVVFDVENGAVIDTAKQKSINVNVKLKGMTDEDLFIEGVLYGKDGTQDPIIGFTDFEEGVNVDLSRYAAGSYTIEITKIGYGEIVGMDEETFMPIFENSLKADEGQSLATLNFAIVSSEAAAAPEIAQIVVNPNNKSVFVHFNSEDASATFNAPIKLASESGLIMEENVEAAYGQDYGDMIYTFASALAPGKYKIICTEGSMTFSLNGDPFMGEVIIEFEVAETTAITAAQEAAVRDGKFIQNNSVVIVKDGKKYNVSGRRVIK